MKPFDFVTKRSKCATNLSVAPFTHRHLPFISSIIHEPRECELRPSILELDTKVTNHLLVKWLEIVVQAHVIYLCFGELWMSHPIGEVTVIGEEDETGAVSIESPNWFQFVIFVRQ